MNLMLQGPAVQNVYKKRSAEVRELLKRDGLSVAFYLRTKKIPLAYAEELGIVEELGKDDLISAKQGKHTLPCVMELTKSLAWLLGIYVAEGHRRHKQVNISNSDPAIIAKATQAFSELGLPVYRSPEAIVCCSVVVEKFFAALGMGGHSPTKRIPTEAYGWPEPYLLALWEGLFDGDGSQEETRESYWTTSPWLASDVMLLAGRCDKKAGRISFKRRKAHHYDRFQVHVPRNEHKFLASITTPIGLLDRLNTETDSRPRAAVAAISRHKKWSKDRGYPPGIRRLSLEQLRDDYSCLDHEAASLERLSHLVDGDLAWDEVKMVRDTGIELPIFDLEVRPNGDHIENFLAGEGGVFVSNTAGLLDPGFSGSVTLEMTNLTRIPIRLYPGLAVAQLVFQMMTSPAEIPYGHPSLGSHYQGQRGATASRYDPKK